MQWTISACGDIKRNMGLPLNFKRRITKNNVADQPTRYKPLRSNKSSVQYQQELHRRASKLEIRRKYGMRERDRLVVEPHIANEAAKNTRTGALAYTGDD